MARGQKNTAQEPEINSGFLCCKSAVGELIRKAEQEKNQILREFKGFYTGAIDITIYPVQHVMGHSIAGDLTVNGEVCRTYDPVDICFLDLNTLMMKRMLEARSER